MQVKNLKLKKKITMSDGTVMEVEISDKIYNAIKEQYNVESVTEAYIEKFFEDVLRDAILKSNSPFM